MKIRIIERGYENTDVLSDWFDVTQEELDIIKCRFTVEIDYGKDYYLSEAKAHYERSMAAEAKRKEAAAKRNAEKEAKDLERKRKQLEKLKMELGE